MTETADVTYSIIWSAQYSLQSAMKMNLLRRGSTFQHLNNGSMQSYKVPIKYTKIRALPTKVIFRMCGALGNI